MIIGLGFAADMMPRGGSEEVDERFDDRTAFGLDFLSCQTRQGLITGRVEIH